ncbi:MAG: preprotein translocase subunit YajC [Deltaproteobacteria bacterium]|nr:preprotein translocase subunit YajC [Deltaproteobacteria bacterium]
MTLFVIAQAAGGAPPPGQPQAPAGTVATAPIAAPATTPTGAPAARTAVMPSHQDPSAQAGGSMWSTLIFFGVMILVFWLLIIRPQQKQKKKQEELLNALKSGDKVLTSGGVIGRIVSVAGNVVTLEIAKDTRVRVVKGSISGHYSEEGEVQPTKK